MKKKFVSAVLTILVAAFATATPVFAANDIFCDGNVSSAVSDSICDNGSEDGAITIVKNLIYTAIGIGGLVAVIFIILGGFSYMTSAGDASKLKKAKDTILYAVIGLFVCILAFAIVNFVLGALK